ncbi:MAG: FprA family A-type flavoprotein [Actinobacteria bacterium]|nr:FprA family A-type flavoprotein [Actinomycetota bacterium]
MRARDVVPGLQSVGVVDWDRRLFDSLIPLPEGTSYNAYLLRSGEATVLFDTVDPAMTGTLLENLAGVDRLDYVVIQHAEQDHSGSLPAVLARHPEAQVLCGPKAVDLIVEHLHVDANKLRVVADDEELRVGDKTLRFLHTPWVHWPETICTYVVEDRVLLSCDFLGSHLATSEVFAVDAEVLPAAKRYYAEILMPFHTVVSRNLARVETLEPAIIAPSHGPVYGRPALILDAYHDWVDGPPHNVAVIPYVTMHGSTRILVDRLTAALAQEGVRVERFDLVDVDLGRLATALVDAATIVAATPTVLTGPHPAMVSALYLANALRPKAKFVSLLGSYGWATKVADVAQSLISGLRAELVDPVLVKGAPREEDLQRVDALAKAIAAKHAEAGLA